MGHNFIIFYYVFVLLLFTFYIILPYVYRLQTAYCLSAQCAITWLLHIACQYAELSSLSNQTRPLFFNIMLRMLDCTDSLRSENQVIIIIIIIMVNLIRRPLQVLSGAVQTKQLHRRDVKHNNTRKQRDKQPLDRLSFTAGKKISFAIYMNSLE